MPTQQKSPVFTVDYSVFSCRHIQEHLNDKEFPEDGQFAEDIEAIKKGDDTKGLFISIVVLVTLE